MSVRELLDRYGLRPRRGLAQNFLVDRNILTSLVEAAEVEGWPVLEVGPGLGHLSELLLERTSRVVAVELDPALVAVLHDRLPGLEVVHGDILKLDPGRLMGNEAYVAVGNLPYYIASAVLRHLQEAEAPPERLMVTVQREVAERLTARPGGMSLLSVAVHFHGRPEIVRRIPAGAFYPAPKVDSAAVLIRRCQPPLPRQAWPAFFDLVRAGFRERRKQLHNSLARSHLAGPETLTGALEGAGIDPRRRAQTLSVEEWVALFRRLEAG